EAARRARRSRDHQGDGGARRDGPPQAVAPVGGASDRRRMEDHPQARQDRRPMTTTTATTPTTPTPRPRLYAHRGAAAEAPENTLDSFARALAHGADALEMDVHLTRDGVVVVSHDPDGARMCGVGRRFADANWDEIRRWDAGWGFVAPDESRPFAGRG